MDELEAVQRLLAEPPPPAPHVVAAARAGLERAGAVPASGFSPVHLNGDRPMAGPDPASSRRWHRWRGWLVPVTAAVAVAAAIGISVAVSSTVGSRAPRPVASTPAAFRQVPPYFVILTGHAVPDQGERAEVVATATGAVLGSVTVPRPYQVFSEVAAAGDDHTFVLAAQRGTRVGYVSGHGPLMYYGTGSARFYKLALARSGRPTALTALPAPRVTGDLNGFALSPDGSKLAVSVLPAYSPRSGRIPPSRGAQLFVFSLATGAERTWTLPGSGWIGMNKPNAQSLSWAGDNRALLFQEHLGAGGSKVQVRLLDTAAPHGSLHADSRRVPIPSADISGQAEKSPLPLYGPLLMTGDGTRIVGATGTLVSQGSSLLTLRSAAYLDLYRQCGASIDGFTKQNGHFTGVHYIHYRKTANCLKLIQERDQYFRRNIAPRADHPTLPTSDITITEISVQTGKSVLVLGQRQMHSFANEWVLWTNAGGTALIVAGNGPQATERNPQTLLGVVNAGNAFTPLPKGVQAFLGQTPTW